MLNLSYLLNLDPLLPHFPKRINPRVQSRITRLRLPLPRPPIRKKNFNLLNALPRRLRIRQESLNGSSETERAKDIKVFQLMFPKAGGTNSPRAKLKSQFATDASAMPVARVSRAQTSAA